MNPNENVPTPAPDAAPPSGEELIRKVFVRDLREKQRVNTVFKVTRKQRLQSRAGKAFLALTLVDRTGELDARIFENVDAAEGLFQGDDYVLVEGQVITFHGKLQLVIDKLQRLDPEPIDPKEFAWTPPAQPAPPPPSAGVAGAASGEARPVQQIRQLVERVGDPNVKALLLAFLDDPEIARGLDTAPAAKGVHHAYKGGLAEHLLSVIKLAHRVCDHYPMIDRDLVIAGALLHDIGKVQELSFERGNIEYTDEGKLVGHLVLTAQKIREKASRLPNFPRALEHHLTHLVLAHHGELAYGSPKVPVTLEAYVVHLIDMLDARIHSWLELMARDPSDRWTETSKLYDRQLWKGPSPTSRGKAPTEGRRGPGRREKKRGERPEGGGAGPQVEQKPRREKDKEKAPAAAPAGVPTFKPLSALAGETPAPTEAAEAPATGPTPSEGNEG